MQREIEDLQTKLTHKVRGMLWISKEPLSNRPNPFRAMDYFLNGLLLKAEKSNHHKPTKNLFCTKHFGSFFFLGQLNVDQANLDKEILSLMGWVKTQLLESDKVLILDQSDKQVTKALQKKYPKLQFEEITLV